MSWPLEVCHSLDLCEQHNKIYFIMIFYLKNIHIKTGYDHLPPQMPKSSKSVLRIGNPYEVAGLKIQEIQTQECSNLQGKQGFLWGLQTIEGTKCY